MPKEPARSGPVPVAGFAHFLPRCALEIGPGRELVRGHFGLDSVAQTGHTRAVPVQSKGRGVQPVLLAILWTLDNRRVRCELSKVDLRAWELRVLAGDEVLRLAVLDSLPRTLREAQNWRDDYSRALKIA